MGKEGLPGWVEMVPSAVCAVASPSRSCRLRFRSLHPVRALWSVRTKSFPSMGLELRCSFTGTRLQHEVQPTTGRCGVLIFFVPLQFSLCHCWKVWFEVCIAHLNTWCRHPHSIVTCLVLFIDGVVFCPYAQEWDDVDMYCADGAPTAKSMCGRDLKLHH